MSYFDNLYNEYEQYKGEIDNYRNHIQPMTDNQGNNFRHLAASAAFAQKHNPFLVNGLGAMKEADDYFLKHKNGWDSIGDLKNNLYGSMIGVTHRAVPRNNLYDLIFEKVIKDKE